MFMSDSLPCRCQVELNADIKHVSEMLIPGCPIIDIRSFAQNYLVPAGRVSQTALLPVLRAPPSSDILQQERTLSLFDRFVQVFEPLNRRSLSRGCLRGARHFLYVWRLALGTP